MLWDTSILPFLEVQYIVDLFLLLLHAKHSWIHQKMQNSSHIHIHSHSCQVSTSCKLKLQPHIVGGKLCRAPKLRWQWSLINLQSQRQIANFVVSGVKIRVVNKGENGIHWLGLLTHMSEKSLPSISYKITNPIWVVEIQWENAFLNVWSPLDNLQAHFFCHQDVKFHHF